MESAEFRSQMAGSDAGTRTTVRGERTMKRGRKDRQQQSRITGIDGMNVCVCTHPTNEYIPIPENNSNLSFSGSYVLQGRSVVVECHKIGPLSIECLIE